MDRDRGPLSTAACSTRPLSTSSASGSCRRGPCMDGAKWEKLRPVRGSADTAAAMACRAAA